MSRCATGTAPLRLFFSYLGGKYRAAPALASWCRTRPFVQIKGQRRQFIEALWTGP